MTAIFDIRESVGAAVVEAVAALRLDQTGRASDLLVAAVIDAAGIAGEVTDDLARQCREMELWWSRGVLPHDARLREVARQRFEHFGDESVRQAEQAAIREVVRLFAARPAQEGRG